MYNYRQLEQPRKEHILKAVHEKKEKLYTGLQHFKSRLYRLLLYIFMLGFFITIGILVYNAVKQ